MLQRMNRDPYLTRTLRDVGVPAELTPYWQHTCLFFQSQQDVYAGRTDKRVHLLLDTTANTLTITCDVLGDGHVLKLLHSPALAKFSVFGQIMGWWLIEAQATMGHALDYKLLTVNARALILEAI